MSPPTACRSAGRHPAEEPPRPRRGYRLQLWDSVASVPLRVQLSPDFQFIRRPGYNEDRGPVRFYGLRLHLEY